MHSFNTAKFTTKCTELLDSSINILLEIKIKFVEIFFLSLILIRFWRANINKTISIKHVYGTSQNSN